MASCLDSSLCVLLFAALLQPWLSLHIRRATPVALVLGCLYMHVMTNLLGLPNRCGLLALAPFTCLVSFRSRPSSSHGLSKAFRPLPSTTRIASPILQPTNVTTSTKIIQSVSYRPSTRYSDHRNQDISTPKADQHHRDKYAKLHQKHAILQVKADTDAARLVELQRKLDATEAELEELQAHGPSSPIGIVQMPEHEYQELREVSQGLIEHLENCLEENTKLESSYKDIQHEHEILRGTHHELQQRYERLLDVARAEHRWLQSMKGLSGDWDKAQTGSSICCEPSAGNANIMREDDLNLQDGNEDMMTWGELQEIQDAQVSPFEETVKSLMAAEAGGPSSHSIAAVLSWERGLVPNKYYDQYLSDDATHYPLATTWNTHASISLEIGTDPRGCPQYFRLVPQVASVEGGRLMPGLLDECHEKLCAYGKNGFAILAGVKPLHTLWPTSKLTDPISPAREPIWCRRGRRNMAEIKVCAWRRALREYRVDVQSSVQSANPFDDCHEIYDGTPPSLLEAA